MLSLIPLHELVRGAYGSLSVAVTIRSPALPTLHLLSATLNKISTEGRMERSYNARKTPRHNSKRLTTTERKLPLKSNFD